MLSGTLDNTFGINNNGLIINNFSSIQTIIIQPDNKILAGGVFDASGGFANYILRYTQNGVFDETFGLGGEVFVPIGSNGDTQSGTKNMILQSDGKIVVLGFDETNYVLTRYDSSGNIDNSFGTNGIVSTEQVVYSIILNYFISQDYSGNIIIFVKSGGYGKLMKFTNNGVKINSFGTSGIQQTLFDNLNDKFCLAMAIQSNNNIILAGREAGIGGLAPPNPNIYVQYNSNGVLNTSIGTGGIVSYPSLTNGNQGYRTILSLSNNYLIFAADSENDILITKYDTTGNLDISFGINGVSIFPAGNPTSSILQSDGKIIIGGILNDIFMILRINSIGVLDNTFGTNGITTTSFDSSGNTYGDSSILSMGIQSDGNIVAGGYVTNIETDYSYLGMARYIGSPDSNICFMKNTPIATDQGIINIDKIDNNIHTIDNKKIIAITQTKTTDKQIVCISRNAFGKNIPSTDIYLTKTHKILYNNKMVCIDELIKTNKKINYVNYNGDILYNVLMQQYNIIDVAGLKVETLHPLNKIALSYTNNKTNFKKSNTYIMLKKLKKI